MLQVNRITDDAGPQTQGRIRVVKQDIMNLNIEARR